jgi:hypothetical protein
MSVSGVFLDVEFKYFFRNFSITQTQTQAKLTKIWVVIQTLQGPVLPINHTC